MRIFTCIVVDDEPLARDLLAGYIKKIPFLQLVATCKNAIEARLALQQQQPDLLFIDIEMPDLSGLALLKMLPKLPATVLTTAYKEHALTAFELGVMDYLLKPIEFERFFKSISKVIEWLVQGTSDTTELPLPTLTPAPTTHIFVKSNANHVKVSLDELLFVEALEKYVRLHLSSKRIVSLMSMNQIMDMLPDALFVRVHRSFIVNLSKVESIKGNMLRMGQVEIPLGKGQREVVLTWMLGS
jgi:two-component system, LytTR family, response regulator